MIRILTLVVMLLTVSAARAFDTNQLGQRAPLLLTEIVPLIGQSAQLQAEVNAALNELGKLTDDVTCSGNQFPGQWINLAGRRVAPYVCDFTNKWLSINATIIVTGPDGHVYDTGSPAAIESANSIKEMDPIWRWTSNKPIEPQSGQDSDRSLQGLQGRARASAIDQNEKAASAVCGWIGVQVRPMSGPVADSLGMPEPYGGIFDRPEVGSPAAGAGIQEGDVITTINGSSLMNWRDFAPAIAAIAPDTPIYLDTWRDALAIQVNLTVGSGKCPQ
jgi:hypothetical protein